LKTVSLLWVQGLLQAAASHGISQSQILLKAGIEAQSLSAGRISLEETLAIWRAVEDLSADPLFGFHMGLALKPTHFQLVAFTMLSSPTLGDAIEKILKYQRLISDGGQFSLLTVTEQEVALQYQPAADDFSYHQIDVVMVAVMSFARWLLGRDIAPKSVAFCHSELEGLNEYQEFFDCPVHFDQAQNCIVFPARLMQEALPGFDPQLASVHQQLADDQLENLTKPDLIARLQDLISQSDNSISRDRLAEQLGMSGRSLQRKLQEQGSSFQQVFDNYRHKKALNLLQDESVSLLDISLQLGFSETSTFYRAFKRWQGITPGEYRLQQSKT
jgi:AraC-like DNA-binding protein